MPNCSATRWAPVDLAKLLNTVVSVQNETRKADGAKVSVTFEGGGPRAFVVPGHDSRLGQVINNLIDNARSFAPPDSTVRVTCRKLRDEIEIVVDDDGPGIRPEAFDKIFERFYTDRPEQGFGQNSGLGLSISKQIIEAHRGRLWAENRTAVTATEDGEPPVLGARFTVRLPTRDGAAPPSETRIRRGMNQSPSIHASAVLVGARAVLIQGPSGSGKSRLALALLHAAAQGLIPFARLVADDRAHVEAAHGRLLVRPAEALAGLIEVRGLGIRRVPYEPLAVVGLLVELGRRTPSGCPTRPGSKPKSPGITLPRLAVAAGADPLPLVLA